VRISGLDGKLAATGEEMSRKSFPLRATGGELTNLDQPGYYAGYSTMAQKKYWEDATRKTVSERVDKIPQIRFFSAQEAALLHAVIDRLVPQDDRSEERTIPILPIIDERLYKNSLNGFRYEDMPPDQDAYKLGIKSMKEMAQARFQQSFVELTVHRQELILKSLHDGKPDPPNPVHRFWALLMEDCVTAYYAHPWAWDEIGFGGPAYPRGYRRLENGLPEPWERAEQRYEWNVPVDSVSEIHEEGSPPEHGSLHGHGGSH
jgi:Gluconate 2-dehydrogenase subunit 3